jgi:hypothetical protein
MGVKAGTKQLRISSISGSPGQYGSIITIYRYSGATLSSGTTLTPQPLRDGAAASSATSKYNGSVSGTSLLLNTILSGQLPYKFDFDLLVAPGDAFYVSSTIGAVSGLYYNLWNLDVQFEELNLARSL